jgi:hypothetical protein
LKISKSKKDDDPSVRYEEFNGVKIKLVIEKGQEKLIFKSKINLRWITKTI